MPKTKSIEISGWIHQTIYNPGDEPTYHFYEYENKGTYTQPVCEHTLNCEVPAKDLTTERLEAMDEEISKVRAEFEVKLNSLLDERNKWLALGHTPT